MIGFTLDGKEGKILGIGMTDKDWEALKRGKPLMQKVSEYCDVPIDQVLFVHGKTDFSIINDFKKEGIQIERIHTEGFIAN